VYRHGCSEVNFMDAPFAMGKVFVIKLYGNSSTLNIFVDRMGKTGNLCQNKSICGVIYPAPKCLREFKALVTFCQILLFMYQLTCLQDFTIYVYSGRPY
jgi:hypothetical protein